MIKGLGGKTPRIHPTVFVSETAYIIGDVEIEENSSVWPGTVIRADAGFIRIGKNTCIQDNSTIHGDADVEIGDNVVIGHKVLCHARLVGNSSLLGSGCTVNDGVEIGDGSLIASGAVLMENVVIPPKSLVVGIPGKVRGHVKQRHTNLIEATGLHYVAKGYRYKSEGGLES